MSKKLKILWAGVLLMWTVTFGLWFAQAWWARNFAHFTDWWAAAPSMVFDLIMFIGAIGITATAVAFTEEEK